MKKEWQILFYTCTCEDNFIRLVDWVTRDENGKPKKAQGRRGKDEFPRHIKHRLFDIRLLNDRIIEKCLVVGIKNNVYARAILQSGDYFQLEHGVELRKCYDDTLQKRLEKINSLICKKEKLEDQVQTLMLRAIRLKKELAEVEEGLKSKQDELSAVRNKIFSQCRNKQ